VTIGVSDSDTKERKIAVVDRLIAEGLVLDDLVLIRSPVINHRCRRTHAHECSAYGASVIGLLGGMFGCLVLDGNAASAVKLCVIPLTL